MRTKRRENKRIDDSKAIIEDFCNVPIKLKNLNAKKIKKMLDEQYEEEFREIMRRKLAR